MCVLYPLLAYEKSSSGQCSEVVAHRVFMYCVILLVYFGDMRLLFARHTRLILGGIALCCIGALVYYLLFYTPPDTRERAKVERRTVEEIVSVSGSVRTQNTADLGFAQSGVIEDILVREGDEVMKGQVLATLSQAGTLAEYNDALAALAAQEATLAELLRGARAEERQVTETEVAIARANVARVEREENEKVENARRALYSDNLIARPKRETNNDTPPTISGTYTCQSPTTYRFELYPSNAFSGYSYRMLEGDGAAVESAVAESALPFSTCGLYIQFEADESYGRSEWIVEVPNTAGASYTDNLNTYLLAQKNRDNALEAARQTLKKAEQEALLANAAPRTEAQARAEAQVRSARAKLTAAEARIADTTIRAPFAGIVTEVMASRGEVSGTAPALRMTANDGFELRIRIPEIDIAKVATGDPIRASFDASQRDIITGTLSFISPVPQETDGVAYFDAFIALTDAPSWMRTGLNADVDVIVESAQDTLALPRRFLKKEGDTHVVVTTHNGTDTFTPVEVGLWGNDGYAEIRNLAEGTEVIAP